ncbi:phosphate-selective porin OprO and OprP [Nitrosospira briensis]|uniref:Phosphate-selective porin OprO and OprP n=2 Tax=Nitrosospira briensis TaxID=35799 RepID=A0A1I4Y349_9PROT|nr:phosphate-selective porin OprO and OprP [Nitrosospira briensis]
MSMSFAPVHAVDIETRGGPKIKSEDGNFEIGFNARAHLDVHSFNRDRENTEFPLFGSQLPSDEERSGFNWRRTYTTLTGKIYGLNFKFENDFAAGSFPSSLRETWISTKLGPGQITLGQFKPYRGMEELASSNEITMMERPSTSSTGIYAGRQFLIGLGYKGIIADKLGYAADVMSLANAGTPYEGISYGGRVFWVPFAKEGDTLHFGVSYSVDDPSPKSLPARIVDIYGGRRGISKSLGIAGASARLSGANSQSTFAAEAAYAIGPVTLQGEYANAKLDNTHSVGGAQKNSHVQAFYVQASWFVTGERTIYKKERGAFGKPKPISRWGALELAARYDLAENMAQGPGADPCRTRTSKCEVQVITLGANWYVREGLRFMLNYYLTEAEIGNAGSATPNRTDSPSVISFRTQMSF